MNGVYSKQNLAKEPSVLANTVDNENICYTNDQPVLTEVLEPQSNLKLSDSSGADLVLNNLLVFEHLSQSASNLMRESLKISGLGKYKFGFFGKPMDAKIPEVKQIEIQDRQMSRSDNSQTSISQMDDFFKFKILNLRENVLICRKVSDSFDNELNCLDSNIVVSVQFKIALNVFRSEYKRFQKFFEHLKI